jgi:hypothetical protein
MHALIDCRRGAGFSCVRIVVESSRIASTMSVKPKRGDIMAGRFRFSIASLLLLTLVIALLLAGVVAYPSPSAMRNPPITFSSPLAAWATLANEVVFLTISLAGLSFIGKRTQFEFALGFVAFAVSHWLLLNAGYSGTGAHPNMLHSVLIEHWSRNALQGTPHGTKTWLLGDLRPLLYAIETLVAGCLGGVYAMWLGRRCRHKTDSAHSDR